MAALTDSTSFNTGPRRAVARRLGLTGFGRWWARELASMMPSPLRSALAHRRARPVLAFDGAQATLWRPVKAAGSVRMVESARIPLVGEAQAVAAGGRTAIAPLGRAANGMALEIVVALSSRASLRKRLTLPAAIEPNLRQALAYDLDRHTPFKSDELYFDAVVVDRDTARNTLEVDLAAARRAVVDPLLRQAESFGARVVGVTVDAPAMAGLSAFDLLRTERPGDASSSRWRVAIPLLLLVAGVLVALALPLWQKRVEAISLNEQADAARQRAGTSDALRTELERRIGDYNFALERKYAFPSAVQVLDDITHLLPDDTWLTQLELRSVRGKDGQRELALRGESANAGRLVTLLEDSQFYRQAAPRSPTTKIQPGPGEIFDVGAQLTPLPPRPAMPIDVTAAPPPVVAVPAPTPAPAPAATIATPTASAAVPAPSVTPPAAESVPPLTPATAPPPRAVPPGANPPAHAPGVVVIPPPVRSGAGRVTSIPSPRPMPAPGQATAPVPVAPPPAAEPDPPDSERKTP